MNCIVWNFIRENGITPRGRNVAVYRGTETRGLDVEKLRTDVFCRLQPAT